MNLSNCSAKVIRVGPRLPFATRIASVRGPEGHLTKALGNLWARTLFFLFIRSSKRHVLPHLPNFGAYPTPHLPGLTRVASRPRLRRGQALWCLVFCSPSKLFHRDPKLTPITRT